MAPSFEIDLDFLGFGFFCETVKAGISLAKAIIATTRYTEAVLDNLSDNTKPSVADVRKCIDALTVQLTVIEIAAHMDAFALIYRSSDPGRIFLNPLLLMQIVLAERRGATEQHLRCLSLFIAVKIVHEYSHLIHPLLSTRLRDQVKKRALGGENKQKMKTPEKSKGGAKFGDFGEMIEYDLFGGICELYTTVPQPAAYSMEHIILYDHPAAPEGHLVSVKTSAYTVTDSLEDLRLAVEANAVEKPYRGPRGHLVGNVRFSASGAAAESDIIDFVEGQAEQDEALKDPTF
jgi:hypothetical protein